MSKIKTLLAAVAFLLCGGAKVKYFKFEYRFV